MKRDFVSRWNKRCEIPVIVAQADQWLTAVMTMRGNHPLVIGSLLALAVVAACASAAEDRAPTMGGAVDRNGDLYDPQVYAGFRNGVAPPWIVLPYDSIELDRSGCFGTCPSFRVELFRGASPDVTGLAIYEGREHAERRGTYESTVSQYRYARLCQLFEHLDFEQLEPSYAAQWTDDQTVTLTVRRADASFTVSDYGQQGPPEFQALVLAVQAMTDEIEWGR